MLEHQDKLNGSATAFIRAFSDLIKDSTSHLATKEDLDNKIKDATSHLATKEDLEDAVADMATKKDIDTTNKNMQAQFVRQEARIDSLSRAVDTTNKNMQVQFARQEEKIAEIARKLD